LSARTEIPYSQEGAFVHLLQIVLAAAVIAWLVAGALLLWSIRAVKVLRQETVPPTPSRLPRVSVILAARNEEEVLPAALDSLLELGYPDYEIILVDDDSRDRTGEIAEEWAHRAGAAGKLRVLHNHTLPAGWRGKVHALNLAEQVATGDWLLATDADVVMHPRLLRLAMSLACESGASLVSLAPEFEFSSWSERVVLPAFALLLGILYPAWLVNSPRSRRAIAAGAFLLMRRSAFTSLGGYAALRETLIEDLRVAEMFKHNGFAIRLAFTHGLFRTRMYRDWREMFEGLARSAFEGSGSSLLKTLAGIVAGNAMAVLPWAVLSLLAGRAIYQPATLLHNTVFLFAATAVAAGSLVYLPVVVYFGLSPFYVLTLPLATVFYSAVAISSTFQSVSGPGVRWKGRVYPPRAS
jgi:chlorobactene glucosyltransferase